MSDIPLDAVTGAASFTGKYIAGRLLKRGRRVRSLARRWDSRQFGDAIEWRPLDFGNAAELAESLTGVETLYNTYWIRFPHAGHHYQDAVANTRLLVQAAQQAGIR